MPDKIVAVPLNAFGVALEPLNESHRTGMAVAGRDPKIWRFLPFDVSDNGFDRWFDATLALEQSHRDAIWAVRRTDDGTVVGTTRYLNIAEHDKRVEIGGTWYAPDVWAGVVNPACKFMLLAHGFETLGLNRIELKTDARNERSQSAIARLGAVREGLFRRHMVMPDGHIRDTVYYSIIKEEWPAVRDGLIARLAKL
ncbi:MAG: GNAT family N-acetyltransferase [Parvibaculaceae bacterium]